MIKERASVNLWVDVIELSEERFRGLGVVEDFTCKLGTFLGVLKDGWNFDRPCPVHVVEALPVDQFL